MVLQIAPQKTELKPELKPELSISWEPLPEDFELPDDPGENDQQPILAAALTDALGAAGLVKPEMLIVSNFALVAKVDGYTNVKAPDWLYVPKVKPGTEGISRRSYTPNLQGSPVAVVMEFVSDDDGEEYSSRESRPYGKLYFYERILEVPTYVIYDPYEPSLEVWCLKNGDYVFQLANAQGRFWIPELELFIGIWRGERLQKTINWLRWWDKAGNLLLWSSELIEQEKRRTEQEKQRAEQEKQRAELLATKLRELGIDPNRIS